MAVELASAYISLIPTARGLQANLARELGAPLERAGRDAGDRASGAFGGRFAAGMRKAAGIAAAAFATQRIAQGIGSTIRIASDLQETVSKNRIVFGDFSAEVLKFADNSATAFGQSKAQALEATGVFGNLFRAVGISERTSARFSTRLTKLAADLASFNNTSVDEALTALRSGLVGETEPLKRFGVNLNEATLKAKALELGLGDGKSVLDANAKAQAAYALIMEQTALAQGDFARTSGGLANQQRILAAQWDDLKARIGQGLLPVVTSLVSFTNTKLLPALESTGRTVGDLASDAFGKLRDIWSELGQGNAGASFAVELGKLVGLAEDHPLVSALATALERVGAAVGTAFDAVRGFAGFIGDEITGAVDTARQSWVDYREKGVGPVADALDRIKDVAGDVNTLLATQRDILIPAAAAAAGFAAAFVTYTQVARTVTAVQTSLALLGPALGSAFAPLLASPVGLIVAGIVALAAAFTAAYLNIRPFRDAVDSVVDVLGDLASQALDVGERIVDALAIGPQLAGGLVRSLRGVGSTIARSVVAPLRPLGRFIATQILPTIAAVGEFFAAVFARIQQAVGFVLPPLRLIAGVIADQLVAGLTVLATVATEAFGIIVRDIGNLAQLAGSVLAPVFDAFLTATDIVFGGVTAIIEAFLSVVRGVFRVLTGIVSLDFATAWQGLRDIFLGPFEAFGGFLVNFGEETVAFFAGLPGRIGDIAANLFGGFAESVRGYIEAGRDIITTIFNEITEFFSGLPARISEFAGDIGTAALELGKEVIGKLLTGLGGAGEAIGQLGSEMFDAVAGLGKQLINGVIDALNDLLPNSIAKVEAFGVTILPGINLPDDPIPKLAAGAMLRPSNGGTLFLGAEAGKAELVAPLSATTWRGLADILAPMLHQSDAGRGGGPLVGEMHIHYPPDVPSLHAAHQELRTLASSAP